MTNRPPFFSVVMPTYNRARLLPLAIESVLQQTIEDFELIISNGGATDEAILVYNRINDFVACNLRYIENDKLLGELSASQREYIIGRHNTAGRIGELEDYVISIKQSTEK